MNKNKENKQFNNMLDIVYKDIKNIDYDKDFQKVKRTNSNKNIVKNPVKSLGHEIGKRAITYPILIDKFKGGDWDHKPVAKKVVDQHYHNIDKNIQGKPAVIFGSKIPEDDKNVYDHDMWGNISYGYVMKKAGFSDFETEKGAKIDDIAQGVINGKKVDDKDDPMVKFGMDLYKKYGDELTKEDLEKEIIENKDIFRRYKKDELNDRRYETKGGEDLDIIGKKYEITGKQLKDYNDDHNQGVKGLNTRQSLLPDIKPIIPTPTERSEMNRQNSFKQTPVPMSEDEIRDLMKTDAYNNKYNPDYEKTQRKVRKAYEELYPDENKAENDFEDMKRNPENYYIWRAVFDSKTRSSHAMRDGEVFCWDNPPEGGHPGEDYNCRCEAEEYIPSKRNY